VRIETLPLIIGVVVALLGIGIIFDAWGPDSSVSQERRRRPRIERHRNGEALIGLGVLALAAAFIGRDSWRYSVLVVLIGAAFLLIGALLNARYVRELFVNRGPLRRREDTSSDFAQERPAATPVKAQPPATPTPVQARPPAPPIQAQPPATPLQAQPPVASDVEKPIPSAPAEPPRRESPRRKRGGDGWDGPERRRTPRG
jgi:hypothetical protein